MAVLRDIPSDGSSSGMEWMAMAAVLGALYCTVLGVFKRFRASMNFSMAEIQPARVQEPPRAVYRPFSSDSTYSFNVVQEGPNGSTSSAYPNVPKAEPARTRPKSATPKVPSASLAPQAPGSPPASLLQPGTSAGASKSESKPSSSSKKTKTSDSDKTGNSKESKGKKRDKSEGKELTEKEKIKKEKAKKERHERKKKEEKQRKEKENKLKAKEEKKSKGKAPAQQVASVTIDEEAVASNRAATNPTSNLVGKSPMSTQATSRNPIARNPVASPPQYQEEVFSKVNPKVQPASNPNQGGFTSSWDQVAQHRQNMQRDVTTFSTPSKNLRTMAGQKEVNSLYITSANSPRNNNPNKPANRSVRYSPPSSGAESDTEA